MLAGAAMMTVAADTVTLKSGSVLVGKVGAVADGKLKFTSDDLGAVAVPVDKIAKVVTEAENAPKKEVPVAELPIEEKPPETWHGSVNFAYSGDRGNSYKNAGSVLAKVERRWTDDRFASNFGYYYSESGTDKNSSTKSTDRWLLDARHDHFWTQKNFTFLGGRYEVDKIAELDYRARLFAGYGYQYLENYSEEHTGIWNFNQQIGLSYIKEQYAVDNEDCKDGDAAFTYRHEFKFIPKWNKDMELFHNFEYLPEFEDYHTYLLRADLGFSTKLVMNFNLIVKILWDYNSRPASDREQLDTHYVVGLGYKW